MKRRLLDLAWLTLIGLVFSQSAYAADLAFPGGSLTFAGTTSQPMSGPVKVTLLLTALSLLPAMFVAVTSFTRIIIVLAMLRQAIGMPSTPPNAVLISLGLFLTVFTMMPVIDKVNTAAAQPYFLGKISEKQAFNAGVVPLRQFLISQTREKDVALILELERRDMPESIDDVGMFELIPAYMLSELNTAFEIGFIVFLPFILIDLVVASVLMSLGMIMIPPLAISLPLKILMFILIDGWGLVVGSLVRSFQT